MLPGAASCGAQQPLIAFLYCIDNQLMISGWTQQVTGSLVTQVRLNTYELFIEVDQHAGDALVAVSHGKGAVELPITLEITHPVLFLPSLFHREAQ